MIIYLLCCQNAFKNRVKVMLLKAVLHVFVMGDWIIHIDFQLKKTNGGWNAMLKNFWERVMPPR